MHAVLRALSPAVSLRPPSGLLFGRGRAVGGCQQLRSQTTQVQSASSSWE
jgi:hypothetical protein